MPRPRILPFIILGVLNKRGASTGKIVLDEFQNEISEFWTGAHSQLYPELQKMTDEGRVSIVPNQTNAKTVVYEITSIGKADLEAWLQEPVTEQNSALTSLKLYFVQERQAPELRAMIIADVKLHVEKLHHLQGRFTDLFSEADQIAGNYGHYLILTRAIERETNYVAWANGVLNDLDN